MYNLFKNVSGGEWYLYSLNNSVSLINGTKDIDIYTQERTDDYIKTSAKVMEKVFRKTDYLCRVGGDEFAFLLAKTDNNTAKFWKE